jgi:CRP-like cAMP-binding protein
MEAQLLSLVEQNIASKLSTAERLELNECCRSIQTLIASAQTVDSPGLSLRVPKAVTAPKSKEGLTKPLLENPEDPEKPKEKGLGGQLFAKFQTTVASTVANSTQISALNMIESLRKTATDTDDEAHRANSVGIIYPTSQGKIMWDSLICIFVVFIVLVVPIEIGFALEDDFLMAIGLFSELCFIADVFIAFKTAYFDHEELVMVVDRKKIAQKYMKTWFVFDVAASIPFDFIILLSSSDGVDGAGAGAFFKALRVARFTKIIRLLRMQSQVKHSRNSRRPMVKPHHQRLLYLVATFLLVTHSLVCLYWGAGRAGSWGGINNSMDISLGERYSHGLFWVLKAMLGEVDTSGPWVDSKTGELTDDPPVGFVVFCNWIIMLGIIVQAIIIGGISSLFANLDRLKADQEAHLDCVLQVMQERNVPYELQRMVCGYFSFMWATGQTNNHKVKPPLDHPTSLLPSRSPHLTPSLSITPLLWQNLFVDLPQDVRMQLNVAFKHHLIQHCRLFSRIDSSSMLSLVSVLASRIAIPDSFIYVEDERGSEVFFVSKGECMMNWTDKRSGSDSDIEVKGKVVAGGARGGPNGGRRKQGRFEDEDSDTEDEEEDEELRYTMTQGAVFGELVLLGNKIRQESVMAKSFVELEVLPKSSFDR